MKIFDKIKSVFKRKQNPDTCDYLLNVISKRKKQLKNRPENLSAEEWNGILSRISFGLQAAKKNSILKSPTRARQREEKIKQAFELLRVYIREL